MKNLVPGGELGVVGLEVGGEDLAEVFELGGLLEIIPVLLRTT